VIGMPHVSTQRQRPNPTNSLKETDMATAAPSPTTDKTAARSSRSSRSNGSHSDAEAVRELFVHATRIQLAMLTSLSKFVVGWAQSADRYAQAISDELLGRVEGETAPRELVGRLATVSSTHLREVSALPTDVVDHFNNELAKRTEPKPGQRQARHQAAA
jgi:hypothetical protein